MQVRAIPWSEKEGWADVTGGNKESWTWSGRPGEDKEDNTNADCPAEVPTEERMTRTRGTVGAQRKLWPRSGKSAAHSGVGLA
ncbi:hypothetical protein NDU88_004365 [Pleurodeles waltl]|uniref:Uncharacterized protein n=1 Tax=Pleurodeles waltl TaxID=8319 RepID=A0AAV7MX97_PLEWA|nr:hypothetical protein NDU88_004365 [Pleurodeles waltl]